MVKNQIEFKVSESKREMLNIDFTILEKDFLRKIIY